MKNTNSLISKIRKGILVPIVILFLIFSSCEKVIDLQPYNQVSETAAFSTPALVALSVTGMYQAAQQGYYNNAPRGYPFGAAFIEQGDNRGEDVVNVATFYQLTYTATYSTTSLNNVWLWSDTYRLINRCNIVIDGVRTAGAANIITAAQALLYEAEARTLRAYAYHELLIHFARPYKHTTDASHWGVPYFETPFTSAAAIEKGMATGRSSVAQVYAKIIADLDFAETNLPLKSTRTGNAKITRANKGAAVALKTRVYLHMWDMPKVITEGKKFLTGGTLAGEYTLTADPSGPFVSPYSNTESIFGMENSATNNPGVNAALASQYNRRQLVCISPIIWRNLSWLTDDKRRAEGLMVYTTVSTTAANGTKYTNKYKDGTNYTDPSPMFRYAEVLLNLAEAYARTNDVVNGLLYLNMVRNRSLATPATQAYTAASFADNVALLGAILTERRIEFVMEGRRWSDISRLQQCPYFPIDGIPAKLPNGAPAGASFALGTECPASLITQPGYPYTDYRFLFPIPQDEVNANPLLLEQQNPGY